MRQRTCTARPLDLPAPAWPPACCCALPRRCLIPRTRCKVGGGLLPPAREARRHGCCRGRRVVSAARPHQSPRKHTATSRRSAGKRRLDAWTETGLAAGSGGRPGQACLAGRPLPCLLTTDQPTPQGALEIWTRAFLESRRHALGRERGARPCPPPPRQVCTSHQTSGPHVKTPALANQRPAHTERARPPTNHA